MVTVGPVTVGEVTPVMEVLLSLVETIVSSIKVYPVGVVTPVLDPPVLDPPVLDPETPPVVVASPVVVAVVLPVVVVVLIVVPVTGPPVVVSVLPPVTVDEDYPAIAGTPPFPILPKTPNPKSNPIIKARRANIPKRGHNHFGHPDFYFFALLSFTGSGTVPVT